jgi:uncharacterized membrane protein
MIASAKTEPREAVSCAIEPEGKAAPRPINLAWNERRLSMLGGGAMLLYGFWRGSFGGMLMAAVGGVLAYRGATGHCRVYKALGINSAERESAPSEEYFARGVHVEASEVIPRSPAELFRFWRALENLPRFMHHLKSVQVMDKKHSRWVAKAPAGFSVQWDAEIINEEQDSLLAWRSAGGADVDNAGSVSFVPVPGDNGTEVRVVLDYIPPAGKLGAIVAKIFGEDPQRQICDDLRRFKALMETEPVS